MTCFVGVCMCVYVYVCVLCSLSRPRGAGLWRNRAGVVAETGAARLAGINQGDEGEAKRVNAFTSSRVCSQCGISSLLN